MCVFDVHLHVKAMDSDISSYVTRVRTRGDWCGPRAPFSGDHGEVQGFLGSQYVGLQEKAGGRLAIKDK